MKPRPVPDAPRRMIAYLRQSMEREDSISPEVQERACRDHIDRHGDEVVAVISDIGVTGLKWDRRPGVQRAMKLLADDEADGIVVWRWSRISRKRIHQAVAVDAIEQLGKVLESATEPFDTTTAGGRFGREVMLAAAALESEQKAEQWADAHRRRLEKGLPASGGQRLGYELTPEGYVPDERAPVVAELYDRYLAGAGLELLADWLLALGVVSPKTGRRWTKRGVGYYLDTGFAAGLLRVRGEWRPGAHPAIIDVVTWRRYRDERERRKVTAPRLLHPTTRLAGIVRCEKCHRSMPLHYPSGQEVRYRCVTRGCGWCSVRVSVAERAAREALGEMARDVDNRRPRPVRKVARDTLSRRILEADQAIAKLTVDLGRDLIPERAYRSAVAELQAEIDAAERERQRTADVDERVAGAPAAALGLLEAWDAGEPADINAVVRELLQGRAFRGGTAKFKAAWEPWVD